MDLRVSAISLNPLRGATTPGAQAAGLRPQRSRKDGQDPITPVPKALGLSSADVRAQLRSGKSLHDVANPPGVTGASTTAGATDPAAIAERAAATAGRPRRDGFDGSGGDAGSSSRGTDSRVVGDRAKLSELSSAFNVDNGSLNSASSAKELVGLLQQNGADLGQLKNVLKSGDLLDTTA
jgi:hypothetical protein